MCYNSLEHTHTSFSSVICPLMLDALNSSQSSRALRCSFFVELLTHLPGCYQQHCIQGPLSSVWFFIPLRFFLKPILSFCVFDVSFHDHFILLWIFTIKIPLFLSVASLHQQLPASSRSHDGPTDWQLLPPGTNLQTQRTNGSPRVSLAAEKSQPNILFCFWCR